MFEYLKGRYVLVIASNAARIFVEKELEYTNLAHYFNHIISATTDYGIVKKEPDFYRKLCANLGVSQEDIVHVGDHRIFDFEVPSGLGIEAYHFADKASGKADQGAVAGNGKVIHNLTDLLDKL